MDLDGKDIALDPVPERQQLGARQRRVHGGRSGRRRLEPDRHALTVRRSRDRQGPRPVRTRSPRRRGSAPTPVCSSTRPSTSGTPRRTRTASTVRTPARSTCTSTTRRATWPV
jgi:hypothetical protein